jgi:hypothetical protein
VIRRNRGSAYIICELDGSVLDRPLAAFRLVPYFARSRIALPQSALDADEARLKKMEESHSKGDDDESDDEDEELQGNDNSDNDDGPHNDSSDNSDDNEDGDVSEDEEN